MQPTHSLRWWRRCQARWAGSGRRVAWGAKERRAAGEVGELEVAAPGQDGFDEVLGDSDAEIVNGPEAGIEEVMGGRGQGQAVLGAIRPLTGVRMDMGGLQGHVG